MLDYKVWLGLGILLFYVCMFPLLSFIEYLVVDNKDNLLYFRLIEIGNLLLSFGYFSAAIVRWRAI